MKTLFTCPVCRGKGIVPNGFYSSREGMVPAAELQAAIKEAVGALQSALAGVWDGHYSGKGVVVEYARRVDKEVKTAIHRLEALQPAQKEQK